MKEGTCLSVGQGGKAYFFTYKISNALTLALC